MRTLNDPRTTLILRSRAILLLEDRMAAYGSTLSEDHKLALARAISTFVDTAQGRHDKRQGIPLPMGGGKTLASACFAAALVKLDVDAGLVVAVYRLRDLEAFYRTLLDLGVDPEEIGVLHSERPGAKINVASTEDNDQRRIMLVTHRRLQGGAQTLSQYGIYAGRPRDLVIYDESLVSTDTWALPVRDLVAVSSATSGVVKAFKEDPLGTSGRAAGYLEEVTEVVMAEMASLRDGNEPNRLIFPALPEGFSASELLRPIDAKQREVARAVFGNAQGAGRGVQLRGLEGVVWYEVTVPDELKNMVVLDASLVVRLLPRLSSDIEIVEGFPTDVVSYQDLTVNVMKRGSARRASDAVFGHFGHLRKWCREIVHVINNELPQDEGINLIMYPDKGAKKYRWKFDQVMDELDIDLDELLPCGRRRFNIITWGEETATNEFGYAKHTIFVSVLHRDWLDIASNITAANRDLMSSANFEKASDIYASEVAHGIAQAIGRSGVRVVTNGVAGAGTVWLPLQTPGVLNMLAEHALPGLKRREWIPQAAPAKAKPRAPRPAQKSDEVQQAVLAVLAATEEDITSAILKQKVIASGVEVTKMTWETAIKALSTNAPAGWQKAGRKWVRIERAA